MSEAVRENLRNIAIIAHVDHGKTTMVDAMLKQSGIFRSNENVEERVMDSNDIERERGITILAKNTAIKYKDTKINIVDTPGHADFGGEVERILKMVDGVVLLVDAREGAMPQTKFVLKKALNMNLKPIVVINKVDRPDKRIEEVINEVVDLFIELEANDEQLDFPIVYASAKSGYAKYEMEDESNDLVPLFETIVKNIPAPKGDVEGDLQVLISNIDYDEYVGRVGIGRVERGTLKLGGQVIICKGEEVSQPYRVSKLYQFEGLGKQEVETAEVGDIIAISGMNDITIGHTICDVGKPDPLPFVKIDEPTVNMTFGVNTSPFAGQEGDYITSRHIRNRLFKELETNLSLRVEETESTDTFKVSGRGELHLSILIENMRREGFELQVSRPTVIFKEIDGVKCEPIEYLTIDVPEEYVSSVMSKLGPRKAEMVNMVPNAQGYTRLEFTIPARGLIGYRSEFLTDTKGNGIMAHVFHAYEPYKGEIASRNNGALVAFEAGDAITYGLYNAQERGTLFIGPGVRVYEGMVVGQNSREDDIAVNVCKKKHVTNMRASGSDEALRLVPPVTFSLEQCLEFLADDELLEITPKNLRIRKRILSNSARAKIRAASNK